MTRTVLLLAGILACLSTNAIAQAGNVQGTVTAADTGDLLPGVNIVIQGTTTGTTTDMDGRYSIDVDGPGTVLVFSFIGYLAQEVTVRAEHIAGTLDIQMSPDLMGLEELVVIGYGAQARELMSSSVSRVDNAALENVTLGNAATALQGTVSGVRVQQVDGQPGSAPRVILRGGASILNPDGAEPLYIVDGVTRPNLSGINSSDIESMQILKDAAATAIYGARAADGVVIITTKRGAAHQMQLDYNYSVDFSSLRDRAPVLNARDYIFFNRLAGAHSAQGNAGEWNRDVQEWFAENPNFGNDAGAWGTGNDLTENTLFTPQYLTPENQHKLNEGWQSMPDPLDPSRTIIFQETNWQDVLFRTGVTHDHYLNFSGGSELATFNAGIGYTEIDGIAIHTNYDRLSGNLRGRLQLRDNVSFSGGLNFSRETDNEVYSNNALFERSMMLAPTAKRYFEDGSLSHGNIRTMGNPEYYLPRSRQDNQTNTFSLRAELYVELLRGLSFEPSASMYSRQAERHGFEQSYMQGQSLVQTRPATGVFTNYDQKEFDAVFNFNPQLSGLHNVQSTFGTSYYDRASRNISASGSGAATDLIPTLNAAAQATNVSSFISEQRIIGFFGRVNYNYDHRYLLTLTSRYDGASNLGRANQWGFFPALSAGWNIHRENFWNDPLALSSLKLRASYGVSGNLGNLGDYAPQGAYTVGATYAGQPVIEYATIANQELRWEQSATLNLGLESGFFNDRILLQAEVYRRVTDDLITTLAMPRESGFSSILTNLGSFENRGIEMEARANVINTPTFQWNLSFNAARNVNTILKLPENDNENNRIGGYLVWDAQVGDYVWKGGLQEGGRLGDLYGYVQLGVYSTQAEADAGPGNGMRLIGETKNYAGDAIFFDADGNGIIDPRDRQYMGNIYPDWTGGFSTTASYGNLSLFVRMDYAVGHTIFNYVHTSINGVYAANLNPTTDVLRSWLREGDVTDVPKFYIHDQIQRGNTWMGDPRGGNGAGSSYYFESGDYLALREVSMIFRAPEQWNVYTGLRNLRFNLTGSNLHYFTAYRGLAPEEGGNDRGRYPIPRIVSLGVNASF